MKIEITEDLARLILQRCSEGAHAEIENYSIGARPSTVVDPYFDIVVLMPDGNRTAPRFYGKSYRRILDVVFNEIGQDRPIESFLTPEEITDAIFETTVAHRKQLIAAQIEAARKSGPEITGEALNIGCKSELFAAIESLSCELGCIDFQLHESDHGGVLTVGLSFQGTPFLIHAPLFRKEFDDVYRFIESEIQSITEPKSA